VSRALCGAIELYRAARMQLAGEGAEEQGREGSVETVLRSGALSEAASSALQAVALGWRAEELLAGAGAEQAAAMEDTWAQAVAALFGELGDTAAAQLQACHALRLLPGGGAAGGGEEVAALQAGGALLRARVEACERTTGGERRPGQQEQSTLQRSETATTQLLGLALTVRQQLAVQPPAGEKEGEGGGHLRALDASLSRWVQHTAEGGGRGGGREGGF
jgi:hypothetical protein